MAIPSSTQTSLASEKALRPFLAPSFDPADFLNATLPSWTLSAAQRPSGRESASLADISAQTQSMVSQLNAQLTRLSATLTQLTDDILRSGSRLAYEVEVLRGDTNSLNDTLNDGLRDDVAKFVLSQSLSKPGNQSASEAQGETIEGKPDIAQSLEVTRLRTLALVRDRLDSVIKVFGDALEWVVPPSDVSLKSSFISVSAPEPGADYETREKRGKEFSEKLRSEITELIGPDGQGNPEAALRKIEDLKELAGVWKGTSEEKARARFIDGLTRLVEERSKANKSGYAVGSELPVRGRR